MVFLPESNAGTKYAKVFPVPVPASTTTGFANRTAFPTACAIFNCAERGRKPLIF